MKGSATGRGLTVGDSSTAACSALIEPAVLSLKPLRGAVNTIRRRLAMTLRVAFTGATYTAGASELFTQSETLTVLVPGYEKTRPLTLTSIGVSASATEAPETANASTRLSAAARSANLRTFIATSV